MNLDALILSELQRGGPPLWVSGRTYPAGVEVRSPTTWQRYVRIRAGAGTTDPGADEANWVRWSKGIDDAVSQVGANVGTLLTSVSGVASTMAKGSDLSALVTTVLQLAAKVDGIKALIESFGIKSIQRGVFAGIQMSGFPSYYELPISTVNPARACLTLLTAEMPGYPGNQQSISLAPSGAAVRIHAISGGSNYTNFAPFSWEVIEWLR